MLTFITIILTLITFSFAYTTYRFIKFRKKTIEHIQSGVDELFKKYSIPADNYKFVQSLNMDALDSNFSHKELYTWIDGSNLVFVNSDFEDDIGILSVALENLAKFESVKYLNSEKKDVYLYLTDTDDKGDHKVLYFKNESYEPFKSLIGSKEFHQ